MEILTIRSSHSLSSSIPATRPEGAHSYDVNCRQFGSVYKTWKREGAGRGVPLSLMTLGFEQIWITEPESALVVAAIQATRSPLTLD